MAHRKYLEDAGIEVFPENEIDPKDNRAERWREQQDKYGFDDRSTWSLDTTMLQLLYERTKMFLEVNIIDTEYHHFEYNGEDYTQEQLIQMMLKNIEDHSKNEEVELVAWDIWAIIHRAMWW